VQDLVSATCAVAVEEGRQYAVTAAPITWGMAACAELELERRTWAGICAERECRRARVVLLAADGVSFGELLGRWEGTSRTWRCGARFLADGSDGLNDEPRSGRPVISGRDDPIKMAGRATTPRIPTTRSQHGRTTT